MGIVEAFLGETAPFFVCRAEGSEATHERLLRETLMGRLDYHHTYHPTFGSRKLVILLRRDGKPAGQNSGMGEYTEGHETSMLQ